METLCRVWKIISVSLIYLQYRWEWRCRLLPLRKGTHRTMGVIIDVAVTGVDGQSRTSDEAVERPLQVRYDEKCRLL